MKTIQKCEICGTEFDDEDTAIDHLPACLRVQDVAITLWCVYGRNSYLEEFNPAAWQLLGQKQRDIWYRVAEQAIDL
jgi:hypothetical protein